AIARMMEDVRGDAHEEPIAQTLDEIIAKRVAYLTDYQNAAYAKRYKDAIAELQAKGNAGVTQAAARYYHKLLAYKDEYEVARPSPDGSLMKEIGATFGGD